MKHHFLCWSHLSGLCCFMLVVRVLRAGGPGDLFHPNGSAPTIPPASSSLVIKQALTLQKAEFKALTPQDPKLSASPCFMAPASRVLSLQGDKGPGWRLELKMEAPWTGGSSTLIFKGY